MLQNHTFFNSVFLCVNNNDNSSLLKIAQSMRSASKSDIHQILELLHISREINTQGEERNVIVKFNPLYDKICEILTRDLSKNAIVTLSFLEALMYTEEEQGTTQRRSLIVHAQNMIRISGCLNAMSNFFTNGMLLQDTWPSLCRCLATTCYRNEMNQNYCSHIIPMCVQRCQQGNEVFQLANSLLINNQRNLKLFHDCCGVCMFNRQYLKYEYCLQLLHTVLSSSDIKKNIINDTNILYELQDLRSLYGSSSLISQWVTIILHRLGENNGGITREIFDYKNNCTPREIIDPQNFYSKCSDDTSNLLHNIAKEVSDFQRSKNRFPDNITLLKRIDKNSCSHLNRYRNEINSKTIPKNALDNNKNYSFSFLKGYFDNPLRNVDDFKSDKNSVLSRTIPKRNESRYSSNTEFHFINIVPNDNVNQEESILNFRPTFVSTPKKIGKSRTNASRISKKRSMYKNRYKTISLNAKPTSRIKNIDRRDQNTTIGGRIFNVINESCTTIIKSVKNLFKTKNAENNLVNDSKRSNIDNDEKNNFSFNFVEYMKRKEALGKDDHDCYWAQVQECNTCNDTMSMKQKLRDDDFLKDTVKKLKIGINLFGCDFKKISKTFWPDENYMTPLVLYNLYRKLIAR